MSDSEHHDDPSQYKTSPTPTKDAYCYICEDGGDMVECSKCTRACCFSIMGEDSGDDNEVLACVTIPREMENDGPQPFYCPACLSQARARSIDYVINRGARMTMRLASKTSVVLVIYHLRSMKNQAEALAAQLKAVLSALEVNVTLRKIQLPASVNEATAQEIRKQLSSDARHHLAVVFLTESHPGGGWWDAIGTDKGGASQLSERDFLVHCLSNLRNLAREAVSARIFGIACGVNLPGPGVMADIHDCLMGRAFHSILLPTTYSLLPCDYVNILPELFLQLYYFGSEFRLSVLRVWTKSKEARTHTGLMLMDRPNVDSSFRVSKYLYSPDRFQPFGVHLPMATSVCSCSADHADWKFIYKRPGLGEQVFIFRSTCCQTELQCAIFPEGRRFLQLYDTPVTEELWNPKTRTFDFIDFCMVTMKTFPPAKPSQPRKVDLTVPWTPAGRRASILQQVSIEPPV